MELHPVDIAIHIINIVVLFVILRTLLYKPVYKFMRGRAERIRSELDNAAVLNAEAEAYKLTYSEKITDAEKEARARSVEIISKADAAALSIIDGANASAAEIVRSARQKSESERKEAIKGMSGEIRDLAVKIAEQILRREINETDENQITEEFFKPKG